MPSLPDETRREETRAAAMAKTFILLREEIVVLALPHHTVQSSAAKLPFREIESRVRAKCAT